MCCQALNRKVGGPPEASRLALQKGLIFQNEFEQDDFMYRSAATPKHRHILTAYSPPCRV